MNDTQQFQPYLFWSIVIPIIIAQIYFFYKFRTFVKDIHSNFFDILNPPTIEEIIKAESVNILNPRNVSEQINSTEGESKDIGGDHKGEFRNFIHQYLGTLLKGGHPINYAEIRSEIFLPASKYDERARIWMNNIIVLGLLGTASSFAFSLVFAFKTGISIISTIIRVVPLAFIPAATGLFLGIICSIVLSNQFSKAEDEANKVIDRLRQNLPYPTSVADILRRNFSEELRDVLKEFPDRLSFAFDNLQDKLQGIGISLGHTLEELPGVVRNTMIESSEYIHKAAREVSDQFEGFGQKLAGITGNFEKQLPPFITSIGSMGQHAKNLQDSALLFSKDINDLITFSKNNQNALNLLIENIKSASQILNENLDKFKLISEEFVSLYRNVHEEYLNYAGSVDYKIDQLISEVKKKNEELVKQIYNGAIDAYNNLNNLLNYGNNEQLKNITNEIKGITENLFKNTTNQVNEFFIKTLNQIRDLNTNFNNCADTLLSFQTVSKILINNMESNTEKLEHAGEILKEAVDNSKEIPAEVKIFSETLEKHKDAIGNFQNAAIKLNSHMERMLRGIDEGEKIKTKILDGVSKQIITLKDQLKNLEDQVVKKQRLS